MKEIEIYQLTASELNRLAQAAEDAYAGDKTFRVTIDGGLKYKVGEGTWTAPQGELEKRVAL